MLSPEQCTQQTNGLFSLAKANVPHSCDFWTSISHLEVAHWKMHCSHSKAATLVFHPSLLGNSPVFCRAKISEPPLTFMRYGVYKHSDSSGSEELCLAGYDDSHITPGSRRPNNKQETSTSLKPAWPTQWDLPKSKEARTHSKSVNTHHTEHVCSEDNLRCPALAFTLLDTGPLVLLLHRSRLSGPGTSEDSHISTSHLSSEIIDACYCAQLYVGSGIHNSDPLACAARSLPSEPFLSPSKELACSHWIMLITYPRAQSTSSDHPSTAVWQL